jgi:GntR family transcriptional regulator
MIDTKFKDGDRLPSEVKLSETLGVSRAKLREAFGSLWQAGLIEKRWGVGTIVRKPKDLVPVVVPLPYIRSAPNLIRESGLTPSVSDVLIDCGAADRTIADLLRIDAGEDFWLIDRVVRADNLPVQRTIDAVVRNIEGKEFDASAFDVDTNTLVAMYRDQLDSNFMRSDGRVTVVPAPADTAARLDLRDNDPVLMIEYSTQTDRGSMLSYSVTWFNTSRVDIRFSAERPDTMDFHGQIPNVATKRLPPFKVSSHLSGLKHKRTASS